MSLKLLSINIEGQKHLERVAVFMRSEAADIVCLMEVYNTDVASLAGTAYPYYKYVPNNVVTVATTTTPRVTLGVAILSNRPITSYDILYADGNTQETLRVLGDGTHSPVVIMATIDNYLIGATHFTWTEGGSVSDQQRQDIATLLSYLAKTGEFILCGDFNIPRGNEMYLALAKQYTDNIPPEIMTTIDPELHRANFEQRGKLALVVDYVWSSPTYRVSDLKVISGVSDHCGVVCLVDRV